MISRRAVLVMSQALHLGCNILQFYPYTWNAAKGQLLPMSPWGRRRYLANKMFLYFMGMFAYFRFLHTFNWDISDRQRMMHILWLVVYLVLCITYHQFDVCRSDIRHFVNALGKYIDLRREADDKFVSFVVTVGYWWLLVNVPAHAISFLEIPCTPHYLLSLVFTCKHTTDVEPLFVTLPLIVIDAYPTFVGLFHMFFNWAIVFLGTSWLRCELQGIRLCHETEVSLPDMRNYRHCQLLCNMINSTFRYHLQWLPSCLLVILVSINFSASIRLMYLNLDAWIMFPTCSLRCFSDLMTPLWSAGKVNEESRNLLRKWKGSLGRPSFSDRSEEILAGKFYRSCPEIACRAGFLYTFKNSCVISILDRCAKLSTDLLLLSVRRGQGHRI